MIKCDVDIYTKDGCGLFAHLPILSSQFFTMKVLASLITVCFCDHTVLVVAKKGQSVRMSNMTKPNILMPKPMRPIVLEKLEPHFQVHELYGYSDQAAAMKNLAQDIQGLAVVGWRVDSAFLTEFPKLEIVANFGVGYDNVDVHDCSARDVVVTNTPDVLTEEVADTAMALLVMTARELSASERWLRDRQWLQTGPFRLSKLTLRGRRLGIFGLGRIGKAIAKRAEAFGLEVHYHGRSKQSDVAYPYHASLEDLAEACDTLMVVAPGGSETHHAVNRYVLAKLGPDGILVNVGRGSVVDELALVQALETGAIAAAGLDVFEEEPFVQPALIALENVVLLPHVGSASEYTRDAMGSLVAENLISWFQTGKALTPVPETPQHK